MQVLYSSGNGPSLPGMSDIELLYILHVKCSRIALKKQNTDINKQVAKNPHVNNNLKY